MSNKLKEYNDPKVYRDLKIGFASLIVCACLLFAIGLLVSPGLRHDIGIGNATPLPTPIIKIHHPKSHPIQHHKTAHRHHESQHRREKAHRHAHSHSSATGHPTRSVTAHNPSEGLEALPAPHEHKVVHTPERHESSPGGNSQPPTQPGTGEPGGGSSASEGAKSPERNEVPPKPGHVGVEVVIPPVTTAPPVEAVVHEVNEAVNETAGAVEHTVNPLTEGVGVHVEVPEVCVINC